MHSICPQYECTYLIGALKDGIIHATMYSEFSVSCCKYEFLNVIAHNCSCPCERFNRRLLHTDVVLRATMRVKCVWSSCEAC